MTEPIRRVGVIGAGVMGSGIAAHFANAGVPVILLDIVPPNLTDEEKKIPAKRDAFAAGALAKTLKSKPALFFTKQNAALVETGNSEDHLDRLADVDLVVEAIPENLKWKQDLFARLEKAAGEKTIIASNTSGLPIAQMLEGRSDSFKQRFLVMHFFNPVRYMKLLELVTGPDTAPEVFERIRACGVEQLGKGIVVGKDTPNFVGNHIGTHAMMATLHQMLEDGLLPEDVDAITGPPMGHPKSASFRTADLVGVDTFHHVTSNCYAALEGDEERDVFKPPAFLDGMLEKKILGNKTKAGFYKNRGKETLDLTTLEYRPKGGDEDLKKAMKKLGKIEDPAERIRKLIAGGEGAAGKAAEFAWKIVGRSLAYSARRVPEIADSVIAIDDAMKWGYNWELGPFETWDALGFAETTAKMKESGFAIPDSVETMLSKGATGFYREHDGRPQVWDLGKGEYVDREIDPREAPLAQVRKGGAAVLKNGSAEAWDLGDGVLGVTFKTKMNSIDDGIIAMLRQSIELAEKEYRGVLIFNDGGNAFCAGANVVAIAMAAAQGKYDDIEKLVKELQDTTQYMKYSKVPVVAAPYGMTLGGGLELCMASNAVQAAAETYAGLVELGVGLVPGGGGHLNMLWRALEGIPADADVDLFPFVARTVLNIADPVNRTATSAVEAQYYGYFRKTDGISFDRARHLHEAKAKVVGMAEAGFKPMAPRAYRLPGADGIATISQMVDDMVLNGHASEHDGVLVKKVATICCGGQGGHTREVTEQDMLDLEREMFLSACGEKKSQERLQAFAMTGKPLRN